ncbi:mediator of RNA polymerase II transcription subunit 1-like isoform X2 [Hippocampus comes]|uniref:mediator of RNA polymerase II transcription subunit 1-like isoform X2 n=1 Tax=Hippocampus comes TaxID=109280 RepID=UPI00094E0945|nr:PREDICTED: mediator of RNA polymerase II transcription subunit 1-like isoform X2 [Hippocampus comes]
MSSILSQLHAKYASKNWNETFQLVRKCMDKSRDDSAPCQPLVATLERLQEVFKVSSINAMRSRLELAAQRQGMGFHFTEATCYLTADLFYVEAALLPCGGVDEVTVAPHGGAPSRSEILLQPLRSKDFSEFSARLKDLASQYDVPGDNDVKFKLFTAFQHLRKDMQAISHLPRVASGNSSRQMADIINDSLFGCLLAEQADCPLTIHFYSPPTSEANGVNFADKQAARVAVRSSHVSHKLQMASVVPLPLQLDPEGFPVLSPTSEVAHETLPACFVLRLKPTIPTLRSFVDKINQITGVAVPDHDVQWAQFRNLLAQDSISHCSPEDELDRFCAALLPGDVTHTYVFPAEAWEAASHAGVALDAVPFTHAAHVPRLVELLRHQCAINTLLKSCMSQGPDCDHHFEVRPEADTDFSVTFQRPDKNSLAILLVGIADSQNITCRLYGAGIGDSSRDEYIASIMRRCMSIPLSLHALYEKMKLTAAAPPDSEKDSTTSLCVPIED